MSHKIVFDVHAAASPHEWRDGLEGHRVADAVVQRRATLVGGVVVWWCAIGRFSLAHGAIRTRDYKTVCSTHATPSTRNFFLNTPPPNTFVAKTTYTYTWRGTSLRQTE